MKIFKLIPIAGILLLAGCSAILDDIKPKDKIPQDQLTDSDIQKVVNGVYSEMEDVVFTFYFDWDVKGENYEAGPGFSLTDPLSMSPSQSDILSKWKSCFSALKQVNFLVETYENSTNKEREAMKVAGGTGYFFRALVYYHLVTRWGGVPILRKRTYDTVPISPEDKVWELILEDLTKAGQFLPEFSDFFYLSQSAVNALKARVYLALGQKSDAAQAAGAVIAVSNFKLSENSNQFASNFVSNTSSSELVFALANKRTASYKLFYQTLNDIDGSWSYAPALDRYTSLYADDAMRTGDIRKSPVFGADPSRTLKFPNGQDGQFIDNPLPTQTPIVIFRLSEMYLIKAEAEGNGTDGLGTLGDLMEKRYATVSLPATMTDKQFQDLVLDERNRELFGEGFRWYDIKRTGRTDLLMTLAGRDHLLYYPVPQSERDLAGYENYPQNIGY